MYNKLLLIAIIRKLNTFFNYLNQECTVISDYCYIRKKMWSLEPAEQFVNQTFEYNMMSLLMSINCSSVILRDVITALCSHWIHFLADASIIHFRCLLIIWSFEPDASDSQFLC